VKLPSPIANILRRAVSFWTNATAWGDGLFPARSTLSGTSVTPKTALGLTAAYAAINVLSGDVSALPLPVYRRRPDGGRDEARDHPLWEILNVTPDDETPSIRFRHAMIGHKLGWGNGYAEIVRDNGGRIKSLHLLDPRTKAMRTDGVLEYRLIDGKILRPVDVFHIAGFGYDGLSGYSPIELARESVGLAMAAEQFSASFFGNSMTVSGFIKLAGKLTDEARQNLRKSFEKMHGGPENAHRIGFLEQGHEFVQTSISPENAQLLASRQFQVLEIARLFRIPPHKIGDYVQAHLSSVEEANLDYLVTTLLALCEQDEQAMNFRLLTSEERKKGYYVEHNMAAFMRGNMIARAEFYTKLRDLGVLTPNQIARFENLNPIGSEGDVRLVPLNMTSLANAGKPTPTDPPKTARSDHAA